MPISKRELTPEQASEAEFLRAEAKRIDKEGEAELDRLDRLEQVNK